MTNDGTGLINFIYVSIHLPDRRSRIGFRRAYGNYIMMHALRETADSSSRKVAERMASPKCGPSGQTHRTSGCVRGVHAFVLETENASLW